ncbi:hypothetical protein GCM10027447_34880 [Glycomyces halotolerans]
MVSGAEGGAQFDAPQRERVGEAPAGRKLEHGERLPIPPLSDQTCFTKLYFDSREDRRPFIERQEYSEAIKPLLEQINEIRNEQGLNNRTKTGDNHANGGTTGGRVGATGFEPVTSAL